MNNFYLMCIALVALLACNKKQDEVTIVPPILAKTGVKILDYCYTGFCFNTTDTIAIRLKNYDSTRVEFCNLMLFNSNPSDNLYFDCTMQPLDGLAILHIKLDRKWALLNGDVVRLYQVINSNKKLLDEIIIQ